MISNKNGNKNRHIEHYDVSVENREVIEAYAKAKETDEWEAVSILLLKKLDVVLKQKSNLNNYKKFVDKEELLSAGKEAILANMKKYDPTLSMPSSYFSIYIDQYMKDACHNNVNMSPHYIQTKIRLDKIAREYGKNDMREIPPHILSKLSGESLKTILNTIEQDKYTTMAIEDCDFDIVSESFINPETRVIREENNRVLASEFEKLSAYQKYIVTCRYCVNPPVSFRTMAQELKLPENQKKYALNSAPDTNKLQDDVERTLRQLRNSEGIKKQFPYRRYLSDSLYTYEEQAPMEYIEAAIFK